MSRFRDVKLELVRPGPPHNQLLSPLTRYLGMCGEGSPITFQIPLEHRQLLNRLERLRYVVPGENPVPNKLREAEVLDMGEEMQKVLALIPSLNAELNRAWEFAKEGESAKDTGFVHIRLVLSGSELSLLPLELAITPQSFPGEGLRFGLQGSLPIVLTREIRRSRPLPVRWDKPRPVRILYVTAEPRGLTVPKKWHLQSLRAALDPWIAWPKGDEASEESNGEKKLNRVPLSELYADKIGLERKRSKHVKERLHVLMNATIQDIYEACSTYDFTHIHILAHGDHRKEAGEDRYGIALHKRGDPSGKEVVDGERLAQALLAPGNDGVVRSAPAVVTLATCDSGNLGSVLVPGGSIAHDLHSAGIPWVFASQFPLTKAGSVRMIEFLYPRLLRGDDPRAVLYELRRYLYMNSANDHDWSSIVAYASIQEDFDRQVAGHFENQTRTALENQMDKIDHIYQSFSGEKGEEDTVASEKSNENVETTAVSSPIGKAINLINVLLDRWERRLPTGRSMDERRQRNSCYGITGSVQKRSALWWGQQKGNVVQSRAGLKKAMNSYRKAMDEWATDGVSYHWTATQYLCLSAILKDKKDKDSLTLCRKFAERNLDHGDRSQRAWANGTLAELELIRLWHEEVEASKGKKKPLKTNSAEIPGSKQKLEDVRSEVKRYCHEVVRLASYDSFQVESTRRQFQRYVASWQLGAKAISTDWIEIAQAAVEVLTPPNHSN